MDVTAPVDPRWFEYDMNVPCFLVRDWYDSTGSGDINSEVTSRIESSSIWEVLEWTQSERDPTPAFSFIWSLSPGSSGAKPEATLLGVCQRVGTDGRSFEFYPSLEEPDSVNWKDPQQS